MEVVVVIAIALVALWISGSNWEQRSPYFTIFHDGPPVRPLCDGPPSERGQRR